MIAVIPNVWGAPGGSFPVFSSGERITHKDLPSTWTVRILFCRGLGGYRVDERPEKLRVVLFKRRTADS